MKQLKTILSLSITLAIFVFSGWLVFNFQSAIDWWKLRGYEPSAEIARLSTAASFNDEARRLFYVHNPSLLVKADFQGKCTVSEETIVLGCYLSHEKIYVFDVDDPRLEGVEQVTAAHEMLHAVYDRLSVKEKESLDAQLVEFYDTLKDERLIKTIESYRNRDASIVPNELHSILGTEVRELPDELEIHYAQYFLDRQAVVTFSEAYEAEFSKRQNQVENYDKQLKTLSISIEQQENQLVLLGAALADEQKSLQTMRSNPEAYNTAVPSFNQKVNQYNQLLEGLKKDIADYNVIVESRNVLATEEQELVNAIDTRAIPEEL